MHRGEVGMSSSGGSFRVDLERAPSAIEELQLARDELRAIRAEAESLGRVDAGSADSVSRDAAAAFSAIAVTGPDSLVASLDAGIERLQQLIDSMNADLDEQGATEAESAASFRR